MMGGRLLGAVVAIGLAGLLACDVSATAVTSFDLGVPADAALKASSRQITSQKVTWRETNWPFLLDQWGTGRSFHCEGAACEPGVNVFLRTKNGFCNCFNGIEDDDEIDRIGDVDLHSPDYVPLAAGEPVSVGHLTGRKRVFKINTSGGSRNVLAIVVATKCNALVATAVSAHDPRSVEPAIFALLNDAATLQWVAASDVSQ